MAEEYRCPGCGLKLTLGVSPLGSPVHGRCNRQMVLVPGAGDGGTRPARPAPEPEIKQPPNGKQAKARHNAVTPEPKKRGR